MNIVEDSLKKKVIFLTGKGGVGKTTLAWALAYQCAQRGKQVSVASWNPYNEIHQAPFDLAIPWIGLETFSAFREYIQLAFKMDAVYRLIFDNRLFKTFVAAAPGLSETVIAGKLSHHFKTSDPELLIVDMPSSGHALSFFKSPKGIQKLFKRGFVHHQAQDIVDMFESDLARIDFVTLADELPVEETLELQHKLKDCFNFHFGFTYLNHLKPVWPLPHQVEKGSAQLNQRLESYHQTLSLQKSMFSKLEALGMPIVQLEHLHTPSQHELIIDLSKELAK